MNAVKNIAHGILQDILKNCIVNCVTLLCQKEELGLFNLWFLCTAISLSLPVDSSIEQSLHTFHTAMLNTFVFDLPSFFKSCETASKLYIYHRSSIHGLYSSGNYANVKFELLKHVVCALCSLSDLNMKYCVCHFIRMQTVQSFEDAGKRAFDFFFFFLIDNICVKTLHSVTQIVNGNDYQVSFCIVILENLLSFVFSLHEGQTVFFSVTHEQEC